METKVLNIYFAGDLFDAKDLGGNVLLADAIEKVSAGRYNVLLPQDGECEILERTSESIRDADFELLFSADVIVANFDGHELDSGTVTEFCFAKMVDMPAVLLRTDFRDGGDHTLPDGEPWNLMCSHYPRTKTLHINAMERYHLCRTETSGRREQLERFYNSIASETIRALDEVTALPSWLTKGELRGQYSAALKSIGGSLYKRFSPEKFLKLLAEKEASGLY